jgi:DNA-binding MarR family transcriptional regulator
MHKEEISPTVLILADRLHSAAIHLLRRVRKEDLSTGQGPARLSALSVLVFDGPKTLGELAAAEQVKPPTMSRIVANLVRSRLIEVKSDPHDARRMQIRASRRGMRLLQDARQRRVASLAEQLQKLSPDYFSKLEHATDVLSRLLRDWQ